MSIRTNFEKANLKWDKMPASWLEGPYVGNGMVGTIFWLDEDGSLFFEMGRADFYDHRNANYSLLYRENRLKIGHFSLMMDFEPMTGNLELDLYSASVKGTLKTDDSKADIRVFTCDDRNVIVIELDKKSGDCNFDLTYCPYVCETPRYFGLPEDYKPYPPACFKYYNDVCVAVQSLPEDEIYNNVGKGEAEFATAWKREDDGNTTRFYISMHYSYPGKMAQAAALNDVNSACQKGVEKLFETHCKFWEDYYSNCCEITLPDDTIQNYYYLQLYRFASATRPDGMILDLMGPWYKKTAWPAIWWNLNIQATYSATCGINHPEYMMPMLKLLYDKRKMLASNCKLDRDDVYALDRASGPSLDEKVTNQKEVGNLGYVLYYIWEMYRTVMDDKLLEEKILPLMVGALKFLITKTYMADDGKLHIVPTASPEYTWAFVKDGVVEDCSFTIAVIKWLARTIISSNERLEKTDDFTLECERVLSEIMDYPVDENGIMVGKDLPLENSHRHWSHFFSLYPFHEFTFEDEKKRELLLKTFENWTKRQTSFSGFAFAGAASIYSELGNGDKCLEYLYKFFNNVNDDMCWQCSNGMYTEGNVLYSPVIETPFAIVRSVQDMLVSSYNDVIRILPAVPTEWSELEYKNLRVQGAFLVSVKYENREITNVKIESLAGEKCVVRMNNLEHLNCDKNIVMLDNGNAEIVIAKGETAVFS